MMIAVADLLQALLETTVATTVAVLLVLALRRRLRALFGATVAYAAWALVPVAAIAVLLPAATRPVMAVPMLQVLVGAPTPTPLAAAAASLDWRPWLGVAWMSGALIAVLWFARQQRGFRQGLGVLQRRADGLQQAQAVDGLPAAIGLWKPAIVLPADFDTRYSSEQRALMVAHERMHIVRGDLHANALTAAMRCVFWFNPLLHAAARHFRHDQELACDLRVIARHPHARRAYGEAMFKTQLALHPLPLGCHWLAGGNRSHPLKERIAMLKQPVPSLSRWIAGAALVAVLALGVGFAAWSAQPARAVVSHDVPPPPPPPPAPPAPPALPAPAYPKDALAQHINGKVVLLIDIDAQGNPTNVVVDKSEPAGVFDQASIDAARKWKFQPAVKDGRPVAGRISVPVQFESRGKPDPADARDSSPAPSAPGARG